MAYRDYADRIQAEYGVSPRTRARLHALSVFDKYGDRYVTPQEIDNLLRNNQYNTPLERQNLRFVITQASEMREAADNARQYAHDADITEQEAYELEGIPQMFDEFDDLLWDMDIVDESGEMGWYHSGVQ